jgi:hypothetical protein
MKLLNGGGNVNFVKNGIRSKNLKNLKIIQKNEFLEFQQSYEKSEKKMGKYEVSSFQNLENSILFYEAEL